MTNGHRVGIYIYRTAVRSVSIGFLMFGISNVCDSKNNNNICTNNFKHTNQYFFRFDNIVLPYYDTVQLNQILLQLFFQTCKVKPNFYCKDRVATTVPRISYECIVPSETTYIDFQSPKKVYLI